MFLTGRILVVARGSTGQVLVRAPLGRFPLMLGLGSDGTVALTRTIDEFPCAVSVVSPAAPSLRRIALAPAFRVNWDAPVAIGGARFVYAVGGGYGVSDLDGSAHALAETTVPNTGGVGGSPAAFDGQTAFVVRSECDGDRLLAVNADARGTAPAVPIAAPKTRCPVRRAGPARLKVGGARQRADRPALPVGLPRDAAARGAAPLVVGSGPSAARATRPPPATSSCAPRSRASRDASRSAPADCAALFGAGEARRGPGDYRIASRARCRRGGAPAFGAPLPGPRL